MSSIYRDAIRILYILSAGSVPVVEPLPSGAVAVFQGEKRLHAFDFWMRSPDYLADELLDQFDQTQEPRYLAAAQKHPGNERAGHPPVPDDPVPVRRIRPARQYFVRTSLP